MTKHGVHDATTNVAQIRVWWAKWPQANIGVATGAMAGVVVVDVDPRNGGSDTFEALQRQYGALPETVATATGGGGGHFYFRSPADEALLSKLGPGLDVKYKGGYVVAPPSSHESGEQYVWSSESAPEEIELANLPERWLQALRPSEREDASAEPMPDCDVPIDVRENRARRYVNRMPPAISGKRGHDALWAVAVVVVRGFMLPPDRAMAVIRDYSARCQPPWSEQELSHKLRDAQRARVQWGYLLLAKTAGPSGSRTREAGGTRSFDREPTSDEIAGLSDAGVSVVEIVTCQGYRPDESILAILRDQGLDVYVDDRAACIYEAAQILEKAKGSDRERTEAVRRIRSLYASLKPDEAAAHGDAIALLAKKNLGIAKSILRGGVTRIGQEEDDEDPDNKAPWKKELARRNGVVEATAGNAAIILKNDPVWQSTLVLDEFANTISFVRKPQTPQGLPEIEVGELFDVHAVTVQHDLLRRHRLLFPKEVVFAAIEAAAHANRRHPVREYLDTCEGKWDRTARIDHWLEDYLGVAKNLYTAAVGRKWLISGVARIYHPGCKADYVLVLQGPQGAEKSRALQALVPEPPWFIDHLGASELRSKDARASVQGVWIIELSELAALSRNEVESVKAFVTTQRDRFRPAYGRVERAYDRQCIFGGTTNSETFLKDATGNRRFWPVTVGEIKLAQLKAARDQLWGEAVHLFRKGESWWIDDPEVIRLAEEEQEARREMDPWQDAIEKHVDRKHRITTADLLEDAIHLDLAKRTKVDEMRVAGVLQALGWKKKREPRAEWEARVRRHEGRATREMYWFPPEKQS